MPPTIENNQAVSYRPTSAPLRTQTGGPPTTSTSVGFSDSELSFPPQDSFVSSAQEGIGDLNEIISRNQQLKNWAQGSPVMLFGEQSKQAKETSNPVKKALDWYVQNANVPGPYGSPESRDWPARNEAGQISKWNDQVNYVTKNGSTAEKLIQIGALATGVAAAGTALAVGAFELKAGERILVEGYKARGGRLFQVRPQGKEAYFRLDYHALGKQAPNGVKTEKFLHYHRAPNLRLHRPYQGGF